MDHTSDEIQNPQSESFGRTFGRSSDVIIISSNQNPLDGLSNDHQTSSLSRSIRILRTDFRTIFRRHLRLVQSESFGRAFGRSSDVIFVSSNQNPLDRPSDDLQTSCSSRPITSFGRTFGQSSDRPSSSRPITSFGQTFGQTLKRFKSFEWSWTTRVTRSRIP